jgi:tetratricopeptide (TPR) repeat protein
LARDADVFEVSAFLLANRHRDDTLPPAFASVIHHTDDNHGKEAVFMVSIVVSFILTGGLLFGPADTPSNDTERAVALNYATLGDIAQGKEQFTESERAYGKAVEILQRQPGQIHSLAILWRNIGSVLTAEGRLREALAALKKAHKLTRKNEFKDLALDAEIFNGLGVIYFQEGDMRKAETSFIQAAAIDSPASKALDVALTNLGNLYQTQRQYGKAEDAYKRSLQATEARWGDSHLNLTVTLRSLGTLYRVTSRYKEAEASFERSIRILEKKPSSDGRPMLLALDGLAKTYIQEHDESRAEPLLARAMEIARRPAAFPGDAALTVEVMKTYSKVLAALQRTHEAERLEEDARKIRASAAHTVQLSPQRNK